MRLYTTLLTCVASSILYGCAGTPSGVGAESQIAPSVTQNGGLMQDAFIQSSRDVTAAVRTLAALRNAEVMSKISEEDMRQTYLNASRLPVGLDKPITVDWHGDVGPLLQMVSELAGYDAPRIYGTPPQGGAVVRILPEPKPAYDVVRTVGELLGPRAEIRVIEPEQGKTRGVIELEYLAPPVKGAP